MLALRFRLILLDTTKLSTAGTRTCHVHYTVLHQRTWILMLAASITNAREMHATPSRLVGVSDSAEERVSAFIKVASPTTIKHTIPQSLNEYLRPCGRG